MSRRIDNTNLAVVLLPVFGAVLFVLLYLIAAALYPGGSGNDHFSRGFSWQHNYWCNLLNETAINGAYNKGRPFAIGGMAVLCVSMAVFWYQFAVIMRFKHVTQWIMKCSAIISMCTLMFLFTPYHDLVINITGILSIFAFAGTFYGLYTAGWKKLFWFGVMNIVLVAINNFIYYTHYLFSWLPVVQKITFVTFLVWICLVDTGLYKLSKERGTGKLT